MTETNDNTVLVTGGCGFIGKRVVERLCNRPNPPAIIVLDNLSTGVVEDLEELVGSVDVVQPHSLRDEKHIHRVSVVVGDLNDIDTVDVVVRNSKRIVHLAAHTDVTSSLVHPEECFFTNVKGVFSVFETARKYAVDRIVFASSNAAIGEWDIPLHENLPAKPLSPYGATKLYGESMVHSYVASYGLSCIALRFANVYGPYCSHKSSVIAKFLRKIIAGEPLAVYGDGNQTRDYVNVRDIVEAIDAALWSPEVVGVYQIGTGQATTILELITMLEDIIGHSLHVIHKADRKGEIVHNVTNPEAALRCLDFKCKTELRSGLIETWNWMIGDNRSGS